MFSAALPCGFTAGGAGDWIAHGELLISNQCGTRRYALRLTLAHNNDTGRGILMAPFVLEAGMCCEWA